MLTLWRVRVKKDKLLLDVSPTGEEEEENLFSQGVSDPSDLNGVILKERVQDMSERIFYADRAFLVALTFAQMLASIWEHGLSDAQFVTVVTTTTASVFGFWLLVGNYLHRDKH